jgi:hypothetical protein
LTIDVVIHDANIKKVELFAGERCHTDCPRATIPPGLSSLPVTDAFVVVDPKPFTVLDKDFSDGVAGFRLESPVDVTLGILVIIAYDAQDELRWSWSRQWVDIPDGDAERWQIHLDPTTVIAPTVEPQPPGTERHKLWPAPGGMPSCLLLEHWGSGSVERELLGPQGDLDCDSVAAANECAPWIPAASAAAPPIEEASCLLFGPTSNGGQVCMLGGPQCSETSTLAADCAVTDEPYCTAHALCACSGVGDVRACLRNRIFDGTNDSTAVIPHARCAIPIDASGNACSSGPFTLELRTTLGSNRTCRSLQLNDVETPLGPFESFLHIGEGKLKIEDVTAPCAGQLSWSGGGTAPAIDNFAIIDVELESGYHLALPLRIDFKLGCTNSPVAVCAVSPINTDSMFQCAEAMQPQPQPGPCAPSGNCTTGVSCNNMCCGPGEMCTPTGCKCGLNSRCSATLEEKCEHRQGDYSACGEVCCGPNTPCPF